MIPDLAEHKRNAERLIDYYYRPEVAAELAAWVNYVCPVPAARDVLASSKDKETRRPRRGPADLPRRRRCASGWPSPATSRPRSGPQFAKEWNAIVGL